MALFRFFEKMSWSARFGMAIILVNATAAILAPVVAPYAETAVVGEMWESYGGLTLLGTDQLGRDMLTRLLYGARNSIVIAIVTTGLAFLIGVVSGFFAAVTGGWIDQLLSRIVDILMAFPTLIFALIALSILGTSMPVLIWVIALITSTRIYRLSRAVAMDIESMEYVEVAKLRGERLWWIMTHEVLPNTLPPLCAEFGLRFCFVFLFISNLSFLGLGVQPPAADWGSMVRENAGGITFGITAALLPAAAIALLTVGVNLVVDWFLHRVSSERHEGT